MARFHSIVFLILAVAVMGQSEFKYALRPDDYKGLEDVALTPEDLELLRPKIADYENLDYNLRLLIRETEADRVREQADKNAEVQKEDWKKHDPIFKDPVEELVQIDSDNVKDLILRPKIKRHVLLEVYADWCGHCKQLAPVFSDVAHALKDQPEVMVAAVNGDRYRELYNTFRAVGFPTIVFIPKGSKNVTLDNIKYEGERSFEHLMKFVKDKSGLDFSYKGEAEFLADLAEKRKAILFSDAPDVKMVDYDSFSRLISRKHVLVEFYADWCSACQASANDWIEIAEAFKPVERVAIAAINIDRSRDLVAKYGVSQVPSYFYFRKGSNAASKGEQITGQVNKYNLVEALNERCGSRILLPGMVPSDDSRKSEADLARLDEMALAEDQDNLREYAHTDVVELTSEDFDNKVFGSRKHVIVEFYADWCGFCKSIKDNYVAVSAAFSNFKSELTVAAINADLYQNLNTKYHIAGYPTILFWKRGSLPGSAPEEYNGDYSPENLVDFLNQRTGLRGRVRRDAPAKPLTIPVDNSVDDKLESIEKKLQQLKVAEKLKELEEQMAKMMKQKEASGGSDAAAAPAPPAPVKEEAPKPGGEFKGTATPEMFDDDDEEVEESSGSEAKQEL